MCRPSKSAPTILLAVSQKVHLPNTCKPSKNTPPQNMQEGAVHMWFVFSNCFKQRGLEKNMTQLVLVVHYKCVHIEKSSMFFLKEMVCF
jgi:hypothetical protein